MNGPSSFDDGLFLCGISHTATPSSMAVRQASGGELQWADREGSEPMVYDTETGTLFPKSAPQQ
jgi:hypothetical protein